MGDGASEFDLLLADANDFPVAPARAVLNVYLLANPERVWPERNNLIHCHSIPGCGAPSPIPLRQRNGRTSAWKGTLVDGDELLMTVAEI